MTYSVTEISHLSGLDVQ